MKGARINFGLPSSEYVAEVDDSGAAISFRNEDTGVEYVGGGGGGAMKVTADMIADIGTGDISFSTCSKTGTELANAIESGIIPYLVLSIYAGETLVAITICYVYSYQPDVSGNVTSFLQYDSSSDSNRIILVYADGHMGFLE